MRVLQISAAPSAHALTAELARVAEHTLGEQGHHVTTVDLVATGWAAVVTPSDYGSDSFSAPVGAHAVAAADRGTLAHDVREHQRLLLDADLLVLTFPLWWGGMPAILKGWVDRVFTQGFAYGLHDFRGNPRKYGDGAFAGTRGLVLTTAGDRPTAFDPRGVNGGIDDLLFPITHGILWYTGIAPLRPLTLLGVDTPAWPGVDDARARVRERLTGLELEPSIPYRRLLDDYDGARLLLGDRAPGRTDLGAHLRSA